MADPSLATVLLLLMGLAAAFAYDYALYARSPWLLAGIAWWRLGPQRLVALPARALLTPSEEATYRDMALAPAALAFPQATHVANDGTRVRIRATTVIDRRVTVALARPPVARARTSSRPPLRLTALALCSIDAVPTREGVVLEARMTTPWLFGLCLATPLLLGLLYARVAPSPAYALVVLPACLLISACVIRFAARALRATAKSALDLAVAHCRILVVTQLRPVPEPTEPWLVSHPAREA